MKIKHKGTIEAVNPTGEYREEVSIDGKPTSVIRAEILKKLHKRLVEEKAELAHPEKNRQ